VHRPFGEQLEDRGADIAALAASSPAAATATRATWATEAEAETAARIEPELEAAAAARTEGETVAVAGVAERAAVAGVLLAQMVTKVIAKLAAGLPALLMKRAAIARAEAEAESAGRWGEWVGHM
jgi:hypothetical protein